MGSFAKRKSKTQARIRNLEIQFVFAGWKIYNVR